MAEPQRLADFLRERCARNQYGLRYMNQEKTLLLIPWPVAPRPSEDLPAGFQMFREWADLSFTKRNTKDAARPKETATQQKHRFRNALARANGIVCRKDIQRDGAKVYEFVDTKRNGKAPSPSFSTSQDGNCSSDAEYNEEDFFDPYRVDLSPAYTSAPTPVNYQQPMTYNVHPLAMQNDVNAANAIYPNNMESNSQNGVGVNMIPPVMEQSSVSSWETTINNCDVIEEILMEDTWDEIFQPSPRHPEQHIPFRQIDTTNNLLVATQPSPGGQVHNISPGAAANQHELEIKLSFRHHEASRFFVTDKSGCRIYFGKNIVNLTGLLEKEHLDNIMRKFRFDKEFYYGPEVLQQIQLSNPDNFMKTEAQKNKTYSILANMDRGLILCMENANASHQMNIPDVFAMRLCQTRIFPHYEGFNGHNGVVPPSETLQRMQWTKVFDGATFYKQFLEADQSPQAASKYPSPSFSFSLGQRPSGEEKNALLVCLTVTVQRAQQLIQSRLDNDNDRVEVCISGLTSMDAEARCLANKLTETLTL